MGSVSTPLLCSRHGLSVNSTSVQSEWAQCQLHFFAVGMGSVSTPLLCSRNGLSVTMDLLFKPDSCCGRSTTRSTGNKLSAFCAHPSRLITEGIQPSHLFNVWTLQWSHPLPVLPYISSVVWTLQWSHPLSCPTSLVLCISSLFVLATHFFHSDGNLLLMNAFWLTSLLCMYRESQQKWTDVCGALQLEVIQWHFEWIKVGLRPTMPFADN
jgi:hypothetical protein